MNDSLKHLQDILAGLSTDELGQVKQWCEALLARRAEPKAEDSTRVAALPPSIFELWDADRMSTALYMALKKNNAEILSDLCRYTPKELLTIRELTSESRKELSKLMDQFSLRLRRE